MAAMDFDINELSKCKFSYGIKFSSVRIQDINATELSIFDFLMDEFTNVLRFFEFLRGKSRQLPRIQCEFIVDTFLV
jgi:hypothetical protein